MTIPALPEKLTPVINYVVQGSENQFTFKFLVVNDDDMYVYQNGVQLPQRNYTITGINNDAGGEVIINTTLNPLSVGDVITLSRFTLPEQLTEFLRLGDFTAEAVNAEFTRIYQLLQEFRRDIKENESNSGKLQEQITENREDINNLGNLSSAAFKAVKPWSQGMIVTDRFQRYYFPNPTQGEPSYTWSAPFASIASPVVMGTSPIGDNNWQQWDASLLDIESRVVATFASVSDMILGITAGGVKVAIDKKRRIQTDGYYEPGDGGADTYITYEAGEIVAGYVQSTASAMLNAGCAGVFELKNGLIAVREYNQIINVRQMGFKPCATTYPSERIGWIPEVGAFDNASLFQNYDALINKMNGHVTLFTGTFAVGFTGYSQEQGDGNTCCRYSAKNGKLVGIVRPALIALPFADAMVIRTPISSDPDYSEKIEQLELDNFAVCGNWSQQTWAGPTGLEDPSKTPTSGWTSGKFVYDQNGFGTYAIKRLITNNSGVFNCAQDGMPSGSVDYFHHTNLACKWTGKGNNSNFTLGDGTCIDPEHSYANSSPSDDKPIYTLSSDGYSGVGCQNIDETVDGAGTLRLIRPKGRQETGRNALFSVIQGTKNPNVIIEKPKWEAKDKNVFTCSMKPNGGGSLVIDGGDLYKDGNGRLASIVNCALVSFKNKPYGHITNSDSGVIDISGTTTTVEGSYRENGATSLSILIKDAQFIDMHDVSANQIGMQNCGYAEIRNSDIKVPLRTESSSVSDWSYYNNRGAAHPEKRPNELIASVLKSGVAIPAGGTTDIVIAVAGAEIGDFVDAMSAPSSNTEQFTSSEARVTSPNTVTIRLFNPTQSDITIGSQTWSVVVRKRNVVI